MKLLLLLFALPFAFVYSQEIEHKHSIHHAFIENKGQWKDEILFKSQFQGGNLWVQQHKILFHLADYSNIQKAHANPDFKGNAFEYKQDVVHLNFLGSNKIESIEKSTASDFYYNYFLGNDKSKWVGEVKTYNEAKLNDLYNGIDLKLIEQEGVLKYEFHVKPNVSSDLIQLGYEGQQKIQVNKKGNLIIETKNGIIQENKPYSYQIINGKIIEIPCEFEVKDKLVRFKLSKYNPDFELIIDPELVFATYCGSPSDNFGMTATYGYDGTAYSSGIVYGNAYPTPDDNAYDINSNFTVANVQGSPTTDVFISKYSQDGTQMLWTTFLGGGDDTQGTETAHSLICDKQNNIYVYGVTSSLDFPIQNGFQTTHGGGSALSIANNGCRFGDVGTDIFVSKISVNGQNLLASTYIGGSENDGVNYHITALNGPAGNFVFYDSLVNNYGDQFRGEIMLDSLNNCIIASCTRSTNFPTQNSIQGNNAGEQDGVLFKLNPDFSSLIFSTYIGGSSNDACYSVKIDSSYNIVFAGGTSSPDLMGTNGAYQENYNGGVSDGFVGKLNANDNSLERITYLGSTNFDQVFFVEIDRNDKVFLLGQSEGGQFPVIDADFSNPNSAQFIAKLDENLSVIENSTVFGNGTGLINISPSAFLVDICGNMYVSGWGGGIITNSQALNDMPITTDAFQSFPPNGFDFYMMVIERSFSALKYASYLGGNLSGEHVDGGTSRFDKNGVVYQSVCGGCGANSDFPTSPNAWSSQNLSPNCNNLVFKFDFKLVLNAEFTVSHETGCAPLNVIFSNNSSASDTYFWDLGNGDTTSSVFNPTKTFSIPGNYEVTLITKDSICLLTDTAKILISIGNPFSHLVSNDTIMCEKNEIELFATGFGIADEFVWSTSIDFLDTLNSDLSDSSYTFTPQNQIQKFYVKISNFGCTVIDSVEIRLSSAGLSLIGQNRVCQGDDFIVNAVNNSPFTYTYSWFPSELIQNQISTTSVNAVTNSAAYLFLEVSSTDGCNFTDSILIDVSPIYEGNIDATASEYVILSGGETTLSANPNGNYQYSWTPTDGLQSPNEQTTIATVEETTTFTVLITDGVCFASDTVTITCVIDECEPPYVFVPNAFSPNDKNKNEIFYVRGLQITEMLLRIYNRWGELVFESIDPKNGWDGTYKGRKLDPDVFDYYLLITCIGGKQEEIKGNVTILK
jgi:gliding motility-associated-like protein